MGATTLAASMKALAEVTYRSSGWAGGEFRRTFTVTGGGRYPMRGGQGEYQPEQVILEWATGDGENWVFRHAILIGRQIDSRTGEPGKFTTSQTVYLGDPNYPQCEPVWLPALVQLHQPTMTSHIERSIR